jgi:hypothetical protein
MPLAGLSFAGKGEDNASFLLVVVEKKKKRERERERRF